MTTPAYGRTISAPCTVAPHPHVEDAYTVNDPRLSGDLVLMFASKERAEVFATNRNLHRERTHT